MNIGILGCGFIGTTIACAVQDMERVDSILLYDRDYDSAVKLSTRIDRSRIFPPADLEGFIDGSDLVVEAASQEAVRDVLPGVVEKGKDVMIISVGALVDDELLSSLKERAAKSSSSILIPSGAVAGVDGITSASMADIESVTLTVRKPPTGLTLPPSLNQHAADIKNAEEPVTLFEGSAREAVKLFPRNVNVAATIAVAGIGFDRTTVKIIADPKVSRNQHHVHVRGRFGEMDIRMLNQPSTTNPRTSYLAPLSAISVLRKLLTGFHVG